MAARTSADRYAPAAVEQRIRDYASRIVSKRIIAGPLVRQTCARHLTDLKKGKKRQLHFDAAAAARAIKFIESCLRLPETTGPDGLELPFVLQPWQQFIVGSLFGWLRADGSRRFRIAYIEIGKGNGKSPLAGAIGLYGLIADNERQAQIYSAATAREQARILWVDAQKMVEASPSLKSRVEVLAGNLVHRSSGSFFRPVSSEHRGLDGKRVHMALIDEVHEHPTPLVVQKMIAGTKGRRQALIVLITNSGYDRTSVCWRYHQQVEQILAGTATNDAIFGYVCALDEGDDPLVNRKCWTKANPNLGISIQPRYLEEQVELAKGMPAEAAMVARLNFCVWTQASTRFIDLNKWAGCAARLTNDEWTESLVYAGLDLGISDDLCAFVAIAVHDSGKVGVRCRFWTPEAAIDKHKNRAYDQWIKAGTLKVTDGETVDYDVVEEDVLELCQLWQVQELAYDQQHAHQMAQHLQGEGITIFPTSQGWNLNEATRKLSDLIVSGDLQHGDDPMLNWQAANLVVRHGRRQDIRPDKERSTEKIDGQVALIMALDRQVRKAELGGASSSFEEEGLFAL